MSSEKLETKVNKLAKKLRAQKAKMRAQQRKAREENLKALGLEVERAGLIDVAEVRGALLTYLSRVAGDPGMREQVRARGIASAQA